jgi:hypothetical protein
MNLTQVNAQTETQSSYFIKPPSKIIGPINEGGIMKMNEDFCTRAVRAIGTIMMIAWILIIGPVGAMLLGGTTYGMVASSLGVSMFCVALWFLPLVLTLAWGVAKLLELHKVRRETRASLVTGPERITSSAL